jgi:uncharacterized protein YndB with AHSA1/START domain
MAVIRVHKDFDRLTFTVVSEFEAPIERVWQLWADPRQLERWWGPPSHPMTVESHDLTPGGGVTYFMTGPEGERSRGWWRITSADPPKSLELVDGSAGQDGTPVPDTPTTTIQVQLTEHGGGTRMVVRSTFSSLEHMEQLVRMGATEIFVQTLGQMDAVLTDSA